MKIVTIIGARPQFIKAAALSRVIERTTGVEEFIVHTGQHYDENMSEVFFNEMKIKEPSHKLQFGNLSHGAMTGRMIEGIESILRDLKPDYTVIYGDTNSTLAAAIATSKTGIRLAHIEAGLRSFNLRMPEEVNRIVADRLSDILFCPTPTAKKNLMNEGFASFKTRFDKPVQVEIVGDIMRDAALFYASLAKEKSSPVDALILKGKFALCTLHRAENTDSFERLNSIFAALNKIADELPIIMPLHPRTRNILKNHSIQLAANLHVIDPAGYFDMLKLIAGCEMVLTDSGGLQKEAYFFHKPCVTMRDETEWVELVTNGFNILAGADTDEIMRAFDWSFNQQFVWTDDLYGENVSKKIVQIMLNSLHEK